MSDRSLPLWRSLLYVPANVERFVQGAAQRGADGIILDLEDSVVSAEKENARQGVKAAAQTVGSAGSDVLVRVNRPWRQMIADVVSSVCADVRAIVVPKVDSPAVVTMLAEVLEDVEAEQGLPAGHTQLFVRLESARGMREVDAIVRASQRVIAAAIGAGDLGLSLGWRHDAGLRHAFLEVVLAARAAG